MLPAVDIGPWELSTYILAYVLGALAAGSFSVFRLRRLDIPLLTILRAVLLVTVSGFAGAYLARVLSTIQHYLDTGAWQWVGGSSFTGGLIGGVAMLALLCRLSGLPLGLVFDQAMPAVALGQAIGRLGCFAAGCCFGRPTHSWLGLYLPDDQGDWAVRYPTQLLCSGADLLIMALLLVVERRGQRRKQPWPPGSLALLYVGLFYLKRYLVEFLRGDTMPFRSFGAIPITHGQLYSLAGLLLVGLLFACLVASARRAPPPDTEEYAPRQRP